MLGIKIKHHLMRYAQPVTDEPFLTVCGLTRSDPVEQARCQGEGSPLATEPGWSHLWSRPSAFEENVPDR
jgi:hypothetical protein